MGHFGLFQVLKIYAETNFSLMRNIYHKEPFAQPNKILEGLNLQKIELFV